MPICDPERGHEPADEILLSRAVGGDVEALQKLLLRHGPAVRHAIAGRVPPHLRSLLTADDVMQETYADAFLDIAKFAPGDTGGFAGWLKHIAHNNLLDAIRELTARKRDGRYRLASATDKEESAVRLLEMLRSDGTTPSEAARRRELQFVMNRAMDQLPSIYREVVQHYDIELLSASEVAARQNCSPGAVYMRRQRAHRMLRAILEQISSCL
jgi:RNA polymerase sigma-70 factor (ECF subfamily)